eukprot:3627299-Prymnesium_polylepis.1
MTRSFLNLLGWMHPENRYGARVGAMAGLTSSGLGQLQLRLRRMVPLSGCDVQALGDVELHELSDCAWLSVYVEPQLMGLTRKAAVEARTAASQPSSRVNVILRSSTRAGPCWLNKEPLQSACLNSVSVATSNGPAPIVPGGTQVQFTATKIDGPSNGARDSAVGHGKDASSYSDCTAITLTG